MPARGTTRLPARTLIVERAVKHLAVPVQPDIAAHASDHVREVRTPVDYDAVDPVADPGDHRFIAHRTLQPRVLCHGSHESAAAVPAGRRRSRAAASTTERSTSGGVTSR